LFDEGSDLGLTYWLVHYSRQRSNWKKLQRQQRIVNSNLVAILNLGVGLEGLAVMLEIQ
jgi:hypothetical protein